MKATYSGGLRLFAAAVICALALTPAPLNAEWRPAQGPLATRWAKDVSPEHAHPEYPRPQLVRKDWLNLNGLWQFTTDKNESGQILVPFCIESALSGVGKQAE